MRLQSGATSGGAARSRRPDRPRGYSAGSTTPAGSPSAMGTGCAAGASADGTAAPAWTLRRRRPGSVTIAGSPSAVGCAAGCPAGAGAGCMRRAPCRRRPGPLSDAGSPSAVAADMLCGGVAGAAAGADALGDAASLIAAAPMALCVATAGAVPGAAADVAGAAAGAASGAAAASEHVPPPGAQGMRSSCSQQAGWEGMLTTGQLHDLCHMCIPCAPSLGTANIMCAQSGCSALTLRSVGCRPLRTAWLLRLARAECEAFLRMVSQQNRCAPATCGYHFSGAATTSEAPAYAASARGGDITMVSTP